MPSDGWVPANAGPGGSTVCLPLRAGAKPSGCSCFARNSHAAQLYPFCWHLLGTEDTKGRNYQTVNTYCNRGFQTPSHGAFPTALQVRDSRATFQMRTWAHGEVLSSPDPHSRTAQGQPQTPAYTLSEQKLCSSRHDWTCWQQLPEMGYYFSDLVLFR